MSRERRMKKRPAYDIESRLATRQAQTVRTVAPNAAPYDQAAEHVGA